MRIVGILAILLAIIVGTSLCGCVKDSKSEANELIKMVPSDYKGFIYVNFKNIENSKYASEYRSKILNSLGLRNANGEKTGIYINKTKRMLISENRYDRIIFIIEGDYDFDKFKNHLKEIGMKPVEEYEGFKIYTKPSDDRLALTFYKDMIIAGTKQGVYDCINVIKGKRDSLLKNQEVMEIYDKLPSDACVMSVAIGYNPWYKTIGEGMSITLKNDHRVKVVRVEKYKDEETAKEKYEELLKEKEKHEEEMKKKGISGDIKLDGQYLIITVEGPEEEINL
ncbi:conserved hypothetical protein [Methanocaldococcus sp. FS406-22]|uniref:hypothetical protein n=1 Tax=Methanocaldococcus sp. (strain FS406-22) TaxID=644281 RepID=UPI0001BF3EB6|nr:hypothetical protein [Methanocaldococcus sp. FS406-22]ADC69726.1 conserved hypothetical protein [Methanocaldococcus sp. FS406-22]